MKLQIKWAFLYAYLGSVSGPSPLYSQSHFTFKPSECSLTGDVKGKNKIMPGEKIPLVCTLGVKTGTESGVDVHKVYCGTTALKQAEEYEGLKFEDVLILNSTSGNIKLIADLKNRTFSLGSVHLLVEKAAIATKKCVGQIE